MLSIIPSIPIWSIAAWNNPTQAKSRALRGRNAAPRPASQPPSPSQNPPLSAEDKQKASKRWRCRWRGP